MKRYRQVCPLARALDVVGDRWNLLVVRELMVGPRRYTDLLDGLPGVGTNVLAAHLRDLQTAGVVTKRTLPPPAAVAVYELTQAGRALGPSLAALRLWGVDHAPAPHPGDAVRPAWVLMSAIASSRRSIKPGRACDLQVDSELFQLVSGHDGVVVLGGQSKIADATIALGAQTLYDLACGRTTANAASRKSTIGGDRGTALTFLSALRGTVDTPAGPQATTSV